MLLNADAAARSQPRLVALCILVVMVLLVQA
jgi:hypothetical protein